MYILDTTFKHIGTNMRFFAFFFQQLAHKQGPISTKRWDVDTFSFKTNTCLNKLASTALRIATINAPKTEIKSKKENYLLTRK